LIAAERSVALLRLARLVTFALAVLVGWWVYWAADTSVLWAIPMALVFGGLVVASAAAKRTAEQEARRVAYYERALGRLGLRYSGMGTRGDHFLVPDHPYAAHLDLFGEGSLFELLCLSRTEGGQAQIARWLLAPSEPAELRERQQAVAELAGSLDLREDLSVLGPEIARNLHADRLRKWGADEPHAIPKRTRVLAAVLVGTTALAGMAYLADIVRIWPLLLALAAEALFAFFWRPFVRGTLRGTEAIARELELVAQLLERIDRESFTSDRLVALRVMLVTNDHSPAEQVRRLKVQLDALEWPRNQFFGLIAPFFLWTTQWSFAVAEWRRACGPKLSVWLDALGELEALVDLATYTFEHPSDPFPEIVDGEPCLRAEALGHPLLPDATCVRNDLVLDADHVLYVVSGSNMSGKSTWLRSIGMNVVLALAGAPVRAKSLRLTPFAIGASIRILDSLQEGRSRFLAEIRCLRRAVDLTEGPLPLLFLLDEILAGTNSHDRGIGASAVVRFLVARGAMGLMTTHDLALATICDEIRPGARNVHFADHIENGQMQFDYRLHDGVVTKSNALELMRSVGLSV
jgi:hypothetical protein